MSAENVIELPYMLTITVKAQPGAHSTKEMAISFVLYYN